MPKGTRTYTKVSLESWYCEVCDIRKLFQSDKQRKRYDTLHSKFCKTEYVGSEVIDNYGNYKKTSIVTNKLPELFLKN